MSNLTALESLDIGGGCFCGYWSYNRNYNGNWVDGATSFSLTGMND
jgi:hypothetical protein